MGENTPNVSIRNFPKIPPTSTPTIDLTLYLDWIDPGTGSAELDRDPYEMNDRHDGGAARGSGCGPATNGCCSSCAAESRLAGFFCRQQLMNPRNSG